MVCEKAFHFPIKYNKNRDQQPIQKNDIHLFLIYFYNNGESHLILKLQTEDQYTTNDV